MRQRGLSVLLVGRSPIALLYFLGVQQHMCCAERRCLVACVVLGRLLIDARLRVGASETTPDPDDNAEVLATNRLVVEDGYFGGIGVELAGLTTEGPDSKHEQNRCGNGQRTIRNSRHHRGFSNRNAA
jgi:hypothetical protein